MQLKYNFFQNKNLVHRNIHLIKFIIIKITNSLCNLK